MPGRAAGTLADYVRTRRLRSGMTQEALAEAAGLTVDTVGALERGLRKRLYPHTARAIADALSFSSEERAEFAGIAHGSRGATPEPATPAPELPGDEMHDPVLVAPSLTSLPPLPSHLTDVVGREADIARIAERLTSGRLLTLIGPGGIGKTRLAIEAARQLAPSFGGNVAFVELAPLSGPGLVMGAIATTLGVRESPGEAVLVSLKSALRDTTLLIVLDNCEHVLEAGIQVAELLNACPSVTVLATSRSPFRVSGEREFAIPPLATPPDPATATVASLAGSPAVRLFVERATAVNSRFEVTEANAPTIAAVCSRLDGLPLAIELAAARAKLFQPAALLARLDQRLTFLTSGPRDLPQRQQTLRAVIAGSHELLAPSEAAVFRRLGVFVGGFSLAAAEAICGETNDDTGDLLDDISALVDKSLLSAEEDAAGDPRFHMLETIREFALEQLQEFGESDRWRRRHFAHFLGLMERAEPDLDEAVSVIVVRRTRARLVPEYGNIRSALHTAIADGDAPHALRLAAAMSALWVPSGHIRVSRRWLDQPAGAIDEARRWLEQALALPGDAPPGVRAKALQGLGRVLLFQWIMPLQEREEAIQAFRESLRLFRISRDPAGTANCLQDLAGALLDNYAFDEATACFNESLELLRERNDVTGIGWALIGLGRICHHEGKGDEAAEYLNAALETQRSAKNLVGMAGALDVLGLVYQAKKEMPRAFQYFREAVDVRREAGAQSGLAVALQRLAVISGVAGQLAEAASYMRESLELSYQARNPGDIGIGLLILGSLAAGMRQPELSARLCGAGDAYMSARGVVVPDDYRSLYSRSSAGVRRALGDDAFEAAYAAGAALSLEAAIAEALALSETSAL